MTLNDVFREELDFEELAERSYLSLTVQYEFELRKRERHTALSEGPQVLIVPAAAATLELLRKDIHALRQLSPDSFEEFIFERLEFAGYRVERVGKANTPDGGVDMIACPKVQVPFPFLLAVQVKHRRNGRVGSAAVRDLHAVTDTFPFNAGMLVTNTTFSPDAAWFAKLHAAKVQLRDMGDLKRWVRGNFLAEQEWRSIPEFIELRPGLRIRVPRPA